jgi:UDP-4-amino-4,6-dideoxy-N-acetyl-beta-L-altrosamine N-acetyltransferase
MSISRNNILLRSIEEADLERIHRWRNKESIQPFVREYRELSLIHIKSWYNDMIMNKKFEFFMIEQDDDLIGVAGLTYIDWVNKHADLHLGLYERPWADTEVGTIVMDMMAEYGFDTLNLNKLYAEIYSNDKDKLKLFTEHGYALDAVLRDHYFHKGQYLDSHILSLLRHEFKKIKQCDKDGNHLVNKLFNNDLV